MVYQQVAVPNWNQTESSVLSLLNNTSGWSQNYNLLKKKTFKFCKFKNRLNFICFLLNINIISYNIKTIEKADNLTVWVGPILHKSLHIQTCWLFVYLYIYFLLLLISSWNINKVTIFCARFMVFITHCMLYIWNQSQNPSFWCPFHSLQCNTCFRKTKVIPLFGNLLWPFCTKYFPNHICHESDFVLCCF